MPLGSVRVAQPRLRGVHAMGMMGSPDGPVHNFIHVTGSDSRAQIMCRRAGYVR
jgi:hypothetical protein